MGQYCQGTILAHDSCKTHRSTITTSKHRASLHAADQTASAAAALAVESLLTASSNASYSAECLKYAEALYAFARQYPGLGYSGGFYNSGGYVSEEAWAADWLYLATSNFSYINDIISTNSDR